MSTASHGAGIALRSPAGRVLLLKRSSTARDHPGEWCFPGGECDPGELSHAAALRETEEETGYRVSGASPLDKTEAFETFTAEVPDEFEPTLNDEHTEFHWGSINEPPQPLHPGTAETLKKLVAGTGMDRREYDTNGWYEVLDNPLSKVGVYQYSEASILKGGDPNKMIGVYRAPEELSNEETLKSFRLLPWTDDHPGALLGPKEQGLVPADEKGVRGVIGEKTYFRDGTLYGNIKIFSEALAREIAAGKRELSCGYQCDFVPQRGIYNGEPYEYAQKNIRGNHVASVNAGRMGSDVRVLDSAERAGCFRFSLDMRDTNMAEVRKEERDCSLDEESRKMIEDSFNGLVEKLEKKGYSKEYATKVAGKVAAEKGMTGHHDSTDTKVTPMADGSTKGEIKDPEGKESPGEKEDLKPTPGNDKAAKDRREARDAMRAARDAKRTKDEMSEEEEEAEDAREAAEDAEEEKEDEKDESKEARDRRSARDRRAGARDARKGARDRKARDAAKDKKNGMDAAEVAALVKAETAKVVPAMRREAALKHKLYDRLLPITGVFDHAEMTHEQMAAKGLEALGLPPSSDPVNSLEYALLARAQVQPTGAPVRRAANDAGEMPEWFKAITKSA